MAIFLLFTAFLTSEAPASADGSCSGGKADTRPAKDYCAVFQKTGPLTADSHVQQGAKLCEGFFQEAINTMNMFCAYAEEAKKIDAAGASAAQATQGQGSHRGSFRNAGIITGDARAVYDKYLVLVDKQFQQLNSADSSYRSAIKSLAKEGQAHLLSEVHCAQNGAPGSAEGATVVGVSAFALEYNLEVSTYMKRLLRIFNVTLHDGQLHAADMEKALATRDTNIKDSPTDLTAAARPKGPDYGAGEAASGIGQDRAVDYLDRAVKSMVGVENEVTLGLEAERNLQNRAGDTLKKIIADESFGILLGAILKAALAEKWDGLTLANIGVGVVAGAVGLSVIPTLGLGLGMDILETEIRRTLALKETRDILQPFFNYVNKHTGEDSGQVSQSYKDSGQPRLHCEACCFGDSCQNAQTPYTKYTDMYSINYGPSRKRPPADYVKVPYTVGSMSFCRFAPRGATP